MLFAGSLQTGVMSFHRPDLEDQEKIMKVMIGDAARASPTKLLAVLWLIRGGLVSAGGFAGEEAL
jgi:hypothetical protein